MPRNLDTRPTATECLEAAVWYASAGKVPKGQTLNEMKACLQSLMERQQRRIND